MFFEFLNTMSKLYFNKKNYFLILIPLSLIFIFLFLNPTVRNLWDRNHRGGSLSNLVETSLTNKKISPQVFWKTREFYSPGSFLIDETILFKEKKRQPFVIFDSDKWISKEYLTDQSSANNIISDIKKDCKKYLLNENNEIICENDNAGGNLIIAFSKKTSEMQTANPFIDFKGRHKDIVKDKVWVQISYIER